MNPEQHPVPGPPPGPEQATLIADPRVQRWVSLALGSLALALVFTVPALRATEAGLAKRVGLAILLVGSVSALAHGMQLTPRLAQLRTVMRPEVAWPAIVLGELLAWLA